MLLVIAEIFLNFCCWIILNCSSITMRCTKSTCLSTPQRCVKCLCLQKSMSKHSHTFMTPINTSQDQGERKRKSRTRLKFTVYLVNTGGKHSGLKRRAQRRTLIYRVRWTPDWGNSLKVILFDATCRSYPETRVTSFANTSDRSGPLYLYYCKHLILFFNNMLSAGRTPAVLLNSIEKKSSENYS